MNFIYMTQSHIGSLICQYVTMSILETSCDDCFSLTYSITYTWYLELFYSCLPVGEKSHPVAGEIWIKLLDGLHLPIERLMQACWRLKDTLECSFFSGSFDIRRHCYLIFCFGRDFFFLMKVASMRYYIGCFESFDFVLQSVNLLFDSILIKWLMFIDFHCF